MLYIVHVFHLLVLVFHTWCQSSSHIIVNRIFFIFITI
ncbi:hypothetical protein GLYMA_18G265750v4 [Glycine max]|nr:hypothetical protein GLYMA_18G265750v4 [Glycine max]KAH1156284.1 hypothetical protein GYH30_051198 [Glycine max]